MAQVVLVHGIGQEQFSADSLEKDWIPALAGGIRTAGHADIADRLSRGRTPTIEARMAFYGDLFLQGDTQGDSAVISDADQDVAGELAGLWLEHTVARANDPREKRIAVLELAHLRGEPGVEIQGWRGTVRKGVGRLSKLRWFAPYGMGFAERFVNKALAQVTQYFSNEEIRNSALERVFSLIGPDTKVLLGHSLGSIVAYEAAHKISQHIPLLLTIGSPLGLDTVVYPRLRPQPPSFPLVVHRWVNVADPEDFIAAEPALQGFFSEGLPPDSIFDGQRTVENGPNLILPNSI